MPLVIDFDEPGADERVEEEPHGSYPVAMASVPNTDSEMSVAERVHTTESPVDMVNRGLSRVSSNGISAFNTIDTSGAAVDVDMNIWMKALADVERLVINAHAMTPSVVPLV